LSRLTHKVLAHTGSTWGLAGIALVSPLVLIAAISHGFEYELRETDKPILRMVALLMLAGAIYVLVVFGFRKVGLSRSWLAWVVLVGLVARVVMFASTPILENDYYRYLWDGGVVASGYNPYKYAPSDVLDEETLHIPAALRRVAREAAPIPHRIDYPWLRTIYPPIAQGAFAIAFIMRPWSLTTWRLVLLGFDLVTLYLLYSILMRFNLNLPAIGLVIYWWNPLLIKEIYNSGHMDVIIFPVILATLLFAKQGRFVLASVVLGIGVGIKFWPAILLPVVLRPVFGEPRALVASIIAFVCLATAWIMPQMLSGLGSDSGLVAYSQHWEMNDALFMLILWIVRSAIGFLGLDTGGAQWAARAVILSVLLFWTFWILRRDDHSPGEMSRRFLLVVAALYLLSPTQFPWYYLWILPLLAINPRVSLVLLTALLPLYYMRYYLNARDMVRIHDHGVVWLEFVPVWCLLIWEWLKGRHESLPMDGGGCAG
jgi:alpha-1,6-mannosyltransferase